MSVRLILSCGGCDAKTEVSLRKRFHGIDGSDYGWGVARVDDPESLTPDGWMMFDPWTYMTYCPTCWDEIGQTVDESYSYRREHEVRQP